MASAVRPAASIEPVREYGLDALRVFAFTVLILYHSGMPFVRWDFHLKNPEHSTTLEWFMLLANRWRLPLLFFISGAGVAFSLRRRSFAQFARERFVRLFIPLVFGMLVIVPPQIWYERIWRGAVYDSYWQFWGTVFNAVPYPQGSLSWHHLWFVAYVFVYAIVSIPVFAWLRSGSGAKTIGAMAAALERWPAAIYLVNVPSIGVGSILGPRWPVTHNLTSDWANLTGSWVTFMWGFVFASDRRLLDILTRRRREFLFGGLLLAASFFTMRATGVRPRWAWELVSAYFGMFWIFFLIGYARMLVTRSSAALRYATEAVYPFYIVHQTILIALAFYVIQWDLGVGPKLAVLAAGTFAGSWATFEVVRRVRPLRPLFGLKT